MVLLCLQWWRSLNWKAINYKGEARFSMKVIDRYYIRASFFFGLSAFFSFLVRSSPRLDTILRENLYSAKKEKKKIILLKCNLLRMRR